MKVLLINSYFLERDLNERKIMKPYPPLGVLYLSASLKRAGHEVRIFDGTFRSPREFPEELKSFEPELVGIYANVITRESALGLVKEARALGYPVILGGPDPTGDSDAYLEAGALAVVLSEGEHTVLELLDHLKEHGIDADLSGIVGLRFNDGEKTVDTGRRARITDLDELPHPDRDGIEMERYLGAWKDRHGYSSVNLITARGCPYHCTWCSREVFGETVKQRSPQSVIEELEFITEKYQPGQIWFSDDVLTLNKKWILELCSEMTKRGLTTRFECRSRVDRVDEEILDALKAAGCYRIWYGAESGSEKMVKAMGKGFTVEKVKESVSLTMKKGIEAGLFILIGYPGENLSDLAKTLKMIRQLGPDYCGGSVAFPIKGTPFYEEVKHLLSEDYAWSRRNENRLSFRGRYPRLFYWFAVRLLHNWSSLFSIRNRNAPFTRRLMYGIKVAIAWPGTFGVGLASGLWQKVAPGRG